MNIKSISKKFLASLLVSTAFIPLGLKINDAIQNNHSTAFANQNSNLVTKENVDFICASNNTYVEKSLYEQNPNNYNSNAISQVFDCANKLVKDKTGLSYDITVPVYIVDNESTAFLKKNQAAATSSYKKASAMINSKKNEQCIYIKNKHFFEKGTISLAHEMIHASLCNELKNNYFNLPTWLNEGIATQSDSQDSYGENFTKDELNKLFQAKDYPESNDENKKYYIIHQRLVKFWIQDRGVNVISEFIDLVNNGKSPEDAFYSLGGGNAVNKLKNIATN